MRIGNKYKIESEPLNVILYEKKIAASGKNKGKEIWVVLGYYATPKGALDDLLDKRVRKTGLTELEKVVTEIESFRKELKEIKI